jgi:hypothetical protein
LFFALTTSALLILKVSSNHRSPIFSKNSGMIERCAEVIVNLVNKTLIPLDIVKSVRKTVTAKDFPDPLPPVIIKYLAFESNKGLYFLLSISVNESN